MEKQTDQNSVTVESLLKLKKNERPDEAFWQEFESSFQRRRLRELVGRQSLRDRLWNPMVKGFAVAVPVLALAGLLAFQHSGETRKSLVVQGDVELVGHRAAAATSGDAKSAVPSTESTAPGGSAMLAFQSGSLRFVTDVLSGTASRQDSFEKVLYSPAIQSEPAKGQRYVNDSFGSGGYQVTTADLQLGRNF